MNLLNNFPTGFTPSDQQSKILLEIESAFKEGYKFVVCCAPTGTGKSFIAKTISNIAGQAPDKYKDLILSYNAFKSSYEEECEETTPFGAFVLTITKSLQDQYQQLFNDTKIVKGKNNYQCNIATEFTADYAPCLYAKNIKNKCWSTDCCSYYKARNETLVSNFGALNYKMFFALPDQVKKRKYLICDEASELEDEIVREFTCIIDLELLDRYNVKFNTPLISNYSKMNVWVGELSTTLYTVIKNVEETIATLKVLTKVEAEKEKLVFLKNIQNKIQILLDTWQCSEYIIEKKDNTIWFTPLKVDNLSQQLFNYGEKIVLMSATIIDHQTFCNTLGIKEYKYIEVGSTFDPKKAPIYFATKTKLNANNLKAQLPAIGKLIQKICSHHQNEKGIIHTHTNDITKYIKNSIESDRFLFREQGVSNEDILLTHRESDEPTILVSPSLVYGVDLKDDLARFQIIIKAPYMTLLDKRIKKLCTSNPQWYTNKMITSVIQMCGRGVRSQKDHCVTYILDYNIAENILRNVNLLPKYFLSRFA